MVIAKNKSEIIFNPPVRNSNPSNPSVDVAGLVTPNRKSMIEQKSNQGLSIGGLGGKDQWNLNVQEFNFSHRSHSSKSRNSMVYDLIS